MPTRSLDKDPLYQGLLLSLPFMEGTGTLGTADVARPHHPVTMTHSPAWVQLANGLWVLDFDGANDWLTATNAATTDLNFLTTAFSGCLWIYWDAASNMMLVTRSNGETDGWYFYIGATGAIVSTVKRAGGFVGTSVGVAGSVSLSTWACLGWSSVGSSGYPALYVNGRNVVGTVSGSFTADTSSSPLYIGRIDSVPISAFNGRLWNPRVWGRALSPNEHMSLFKRERHLFGA